MSKLPAVLWSRPGLPYPYGKLTDKARLAISLSKHTDATEKEIAEILGLQHRDLMRFFMRIIRTHEGRAVMSQGIPAMYGEQLPEGMTAICSKCKRRITWAPCVTCCDSRFHYEDRLDRYADRLPKPLPTFSTDTKPGSAAKIEVLRQRMADGFELWHPDDAPISD